VALTILVIDALGVCRNGGKRAVDVILRFSVGSFNLIRAHSCLHWSSGVLTQAINIPYFCLQFVRRVGLAGDKGTKLSAREVNRRSLDTSVSSSKLVDQAQDPAVQPRKLEWRLEGRGQGCMG
jgi:hypothetical protein